nr:endonuclease-reverse transcriptase [Haemonchus contortus]
MMQARKIKYDVIGLTETRRHRPLHAVFENGEELFLGTCDSKGVGGVGVLVNTHLAMNIDSYESLTTRIGRLRLRRCGSTPALTIFVAYAPTSSYEEEELEAFYMDFNARTLASEACIEDLMMQARKIKYDVIGLTETRRHRPLHAVFENGEELFLGTCDSKGVGGVGVLVNTHLAMNIDSYESLTTRIGRLRLRRCGSTPALTIFVAYAPTSSYEEEELEAFYMDLERL